ncbi:MAG: hypothetical protein EOM06_14025, partial [Sphingobacteriia bacterium]|nr:hypothetical protein [Sphingobacteriia bacterium]
MMKKSDASHMDRLPVDFSKYKVLNKTDNLPDLFSTLSQDDYDSLKQVGLDMKRPPDMGRFLLFDHNPFVTISQTEGVEILPLPDAMNRYPWMMEKYYFKAIDRNMDEFTRQVAEGENQGYFIRVKKNVRLNHPIH